MIRGRWRVEKGVELRSLTLERAGLSTRGSPPHGAALCSAAWSSPCWGMEKFLLSQLFPTLFKLEGAYVPHTTQGPLKGMGIKDCPQPWGWSSQGTGAGGTGAWEACKSQASFSRRLQILVCDGFSGKFFMIFNAECFFLGTQETWGQLLNPASVNHLSALAKKSWGKEWEKNHLLVSSLNNCVVQQLREWVFSSPTESGTIENNNDPTSH